LQICLPSVETLGYFRAFVVRIGEQYRAQFGRFVRQAYLIVSRAGWLNGRRKREKTGATPHPGKKIPFSARAKVSETHALLQHSSDPTF